MPRSLSRLDQARLIIRRNLVHICDHQEAQCIIAMDEKKTEATREVAAHKAIRIFNAMCSGDRRYFEEHTFRSTTFRKLDNLEHFEAILNCVREEPLLKKELSKIQRLWEEQYRGIYESWCRVLEVKEMSELVATTGEGFWSLQYIGPPEPPDLGYIYTNVAPDPRYRGFRTMNEFLAEESDIWELGPRIVTDPSAPPSPPFSPRWPPRRVHSTSHSPAWGSPRPSTADHASRLSTDNQARSPHVSPNSNGFTQQLVHRGRPGRDNAQGTLEVPDGRSPLQRSRSHVIAMPTSRTQQQQSLLPRSGLTGQRSL